MAGNFFTPTLTRVQPQRQEGVIDSLKGVHIQGYSSEPQSIPSASTLVLAATPVTGQVVYTATVNPAYIPFANTNVRTFTASILSTDTLAIVTNKLAAAASADLLFSAYYNIRVSGGNTISFTPKQLYDPNNNLTALTLVTNGGGLTTFTPTIAAASTPQSTIPLGRLVYTPAGSPENTIRVIQPGANGILRGITAWCDEAPHSVADNTTLTPHLWTQDVVSEGIVNVDNTANITARAANLNVFVTGVNIGKITTVTAGTVPLTAASFPNLFNLPQCTFQIYEFFANSPLYKLDMRIA